MRSIVHFLRAFPFGRGLLAALLLCVAVLRSPAPVHASGDDPLPTPTPAPDGHAAISAEALVNDGLARAQKGQWLAAEASYRQAAELAPDLPEAWNGLGHALKYSRRFEESIAAYEQALRLRPAYPQALEYLGEAYVAMGRYKDAMGVLARLHPIDRALAAQLEASITGATRHASW
jgi:Flp pilus assembly protein TadD